MPNIDKWHNAFLRGATVFILGNGPSIKEFAPHMPKIHESFPSISMNRGYEVKPHGDFYVTLMDTFYLNEVKDSGYKDVFVVGSYTEIPENIRHGFKPTLTCIPRLSKHDPPPKDPLDLSEGFKVSHTGVLALHLASWMGFDMAILLGYDGHGRHFMPRVQPDDNPNHARHIAEMKAFMALDYGMTIYNCVKDNGYGHEYLPWEFAQSANGRRQ